ncbi:MAG: c-type cytochrome, partial [Vicinamibacterales bacterium]
LASSVFSGYGPGGCARAYSNNAGTASISVYDIDPVAGTIARNTRVVPPHLRDAAGNLKLRDTSLSPVRWVSMPIQTPVSPPDATAHGRYMVTANKGSFNVSITALEVRGDPTAIYTFPAGLGAHGVTFGRKARCDDGSSTCYYAYVTNTFEDYVSVYDLERVSTAGPPGSATEQVSLAGYGAQALCKRQACVVPITTFCPDCRHGAHVGDVPLRLTTTSKYTLLKEHVWIDALRKPLDLVLDLKINTGAQGIVVPWSTWNTTTPTPLLTGVAPADGGSGTMVFVSGRGFDATPGASRVAIRGVPVPLVKVMDETLLFFVVPPGNPTGPVTVTTAGGRVSNPMPFGAPQPTLRITGVWPATATIGQSAFVFGSGFQPGAGHTTATLGGARVPNVHVLGPSLLVFQVPDGARSGPLTVSTGTASGASAAAWIAVAPDDGFGGTWMKPAESTIPANDQGALVRYGRELVTRTHHYFNVLQVRPGYSTGNDLNCTSCHMGEGTIASSSPWVAVAGKYSGRGPYFARAGRHLDTTGRIQGCLQRSMNAQSQVLPTDSREMRAMVAYFEWLGTGMKVAEWTEVKGQGFPTVPLLNRAVDPVRGERVYATYCASCHGTDGRGMTQVTGTVVPPLWGTRSFNDGAGMFRAATGVGFIRSNMPLGKAVPWDESTQLSIEDAWDVTSYVVFKDRPVWHNQASDWSCTNRGPDGVPDWMRKAPDAGYGPYRPRWNGTEYTCDGAAPPVFDEATHKYGPWQRMRALQLQIIKDFKACGRSPCP